MKKSSSTAAAMVLLFSVECNTLWDPWLSSRQQPCDSQDRPCPIDLICNTETHQCDPMDLSIQDGNNPPKCKAFNLFDPALKDRLMPCASSCHSPGKNSVATGAFDMSAAFSSDLTTLQNFCLATLGRVNTSNPASSILILQITPQYLGGTPNHPYKQTDSTALMSFDNVVETWASAEQ